MRAFEFLFEVAKVGKTYPVPNELRSQAEAPQDSPDIENLKAVLASKIKELPTDEQTTRLLHEIEDLLASIGAGSRTEYIGKDLQMINDPDVNKAQKLLAKYVLSMDTDPAERKKLLTWWKNDDLINIDLLLTPGKHTVPDIINHYKESAAVRELSADLSQVAFLGQGKGEFLLSVFSKRITKAKKGDLMIEGIGQVEVKTTDAGAGRFYDQQVRPTPKYQNAVNQFLATFKEEIAAQKVLSTTGINIDGLIGLYGALPVELRDDFKSQLTAVIANLFAARQDLAAPIVDSIMVGNSGQAKQRYAVANLNNYTATKTEDKGMLMINIAKDPYTFVFFTDNASLNAGGMRLHSKTAYPVTNDPRNAYPQTQIVDTSRAQE